ncbi:uncharacterized protein N7482_002536 [Penicillium canariense]|uniref:RanBP2-type domain-containing protein n=1 Tax=Penicillium canariense TaxID=189055 RepID=A0A9W9LUX5_9EURO|nr:uncharacterized protein N7482_002536 [Penicillium canariense]KAJ5176659.1 hypothetical protein N7482_002536 [Penicillium canariense]
MSSYQVTFAERSGLTLPLRQDFSVLSMHQVEVETIREFVDADILSSRPVQPLYRATPTGYAGSGAPIQSADWWTCCNCNSLTNPALAPDRCPLCAHYKCGECTKTVV